MTRRGRRGREKGEIERRLHWSDHYWFVSTNEKIRLLIKNNCSIWAEGGPGLFIYCASEVTVCHFHFWPLQSKTAPLQKQLNTTTTHTAELYPFCWRRLSKKMLCVCVCVWVAANALLHFTHTKNSLCTHAHKESTTTTHVDVDSLCACAVVYWQPPRTPATHCLKGKRGNRPDSKRPLESRSVSSRTSFSGQQYRKKKTHREKRSKPLPMVGGEWLGNNRFYQISQMLLAMKWLSLSLLLFSLSLYTAGSKEVC